MEQVAPLTFALSYCLIKPFIYIITVLSPTVLIKLWLYRGTRAPDQGNLAALSRTPFELCF